MLVISCFGIVVPGTRKESLWLFFVSEQECRNLKLWLLLHLRLPLLLFTLRSIDLGLRSCVNVVPLSLPHSRLLLPLFSDELGLFHLLGALLGPTCCLITGRSSTY